MAIKGKKRSRKGRGRAVAGVPRPTFVTPKPPLARRAWFRATVVLVVLLATGGIAYGVYTTRQAAAEREAAQEEVARVGVLMEAALADIGQAPPGANTVIILPEIGQTGAEIAAGEARPRRVARDADSWEEGLMAASARLDEIETDRGALRRSIESIREGLSAYVDAVRLLPEAARQDGEEQEAALVEIQQQLAAASGSVESGWTIYLNQRVEVGLDEEMPEPQTGLPPGLPPGMDPGTDPLAPPGPGEVPLPETEG